MEFDSLLGLWLAAEADRTRRWEIIFPEGLTTIPPGESFEWIESGDRVTSGEVKSLGNSVFGVGGVTVVWGCGMAVCGGVLGAGNSREGSGLSSLRSVRMGAGKGGGGSATTV